MTPSGVLPVLYCSQYDVGRPLGMVVHNGGEAVDLSTYTCTIEATRTDGTAITAAVATDGSIGAFATTATMTNVADKYPAKLVIVDSQSRRVASLAFVMCVTPATMDENAESIEEDQSLYQQYTGTVQTLIATERQQRQSADSTLQANINAEASARAAGDSNLSAYINAEASARQSADETLQTNIDAEASTRVAQDAVLQAEIDRLIAPSGEAPSAAEVENARIGADGTAYPSLGTAIRTQIGRIDDALRLIEPTNKFNPATAVEGYSIHTNGTLIASANNFTSDFIPCNGGDVFYYTSARISDTVKQFYGITAANVSHFAQYDANKTFISGTRQQWVNSVTLNENCRYIRFSNPLSQLQDEIRIISVTFNEYPTEWQNITAYHAPYFYLTADKFDAHVDDFNEFKDKATTLVLPENRLNLNDILENTIVASDGVETYNETCYTTKYYTPVENGDVITMAGINASGTFYHLGTKIAALALYDADKNFLARYTQVNDYTIQNADCKYIRVSISNGTLSWSVVSLSVNAIPTKASISEYFAPYYSASKPSQETIRNRRVLWLGTSIPTYGYPQILARLCGARMYNEAIGSSGITEGIEPNVTAANVCGIRSIYGLYGLTQTIAEKQAMIDNWSTIASEIGSTATLTDEIKNIALASSYETIVDPYLTGDNAVDLIVINHAYNDATEYAVAPDGDKLNPHYLEGAYNWLIKRILEANPGIGIVIFGHYSDLPTSKETALQNVADRWNIPYYLLKNDLGWSSTQIISTTKRVNSNGEWETITAADMTVQAMWLGDGVHPLGVASKRIAQVSQTVFEDWLKMYCDDVN